MIEFELTSIRFEIQYAILYFRSKKINIFNFLLLIIALAYYLSEIKLIQI